MERPEVWLRCKDSTVYLLVPVDDKRTDTPCCNTMLSEKTLAGWSAPKRSPANKKETPAEVVPSNLSIGLLAQSIPVSYTHLTLATILLV